MATPIYNDKEKRWTYRVTYDGITKKFTSVKPGMAGKREVLKKARLFYDEDRIFEDLRVQAAWDLYIKQRTAKLGADSEAVKKDIQMGTLYILPAIGRRKISSLKKSDFQNIIDNAKPKKDGVEILSKKYLQTLREKIVLFINFAIEERYIEPIYGKFYIPTDRPVIGKDILQPSDIRKLFEPSDLHYHKAFLFMLLTGLRPGECLGLKWSDIDQETFTVRRSVNQSRKITEGKNKNAKRVIPITPMLSQILNLQKANTKHFNSEWVFCNTVGGMGSQCTMKDQLKVLKKERDFECCLYSFRHTFVSLVKNALPEHTIKQLVGHSAAMTTFETYGHLVDGELQQTAKLIDLTFKNIAEIE